MLTSGREDKQGEDEEGEDKEDHSKILLKVIPIISHFLVIVVDFPYSHKIGTIIQFYSYCYSNP